MKQEVYEFKESFKETLLSYGLLKRAGSNIQFRLKDCPKCGDRKWHCYIKIDSSDDGPMLFNCFKCNSHGIVDKAFIDGIGVLNTSNIVIPKFAGGRKLNIGTTISTKIPDISVTDMDNISGVCEYINSRIGHYPSLTELQYFHYIGNPRKYAMDYLGDDNISIIKNRLWFQMTNGNIVGRYTSDAEPRWLKYKTTRCKQSGLYRITLPIDLYKPINVIISEGIMDSIGLFYNYHGCENNIYISVLSSDYRKGIKYAIDKGIFGESVNVKIFLDSDINPNRVMIDRNTQQIFRRIEIYQNSIDKDYGVQPDMLDIHKVVTLSSRR